MRAMTVVFLLAGLTARAQTTVIIQDGQPRASIVIADEGDKLAAQELQEHLRLMSGATLPIESKPTGVPIYIDKNTAAVRVKVTAQEIRLSGFNAVYELLEQLGVRWFLPAEIGRDVPQMKTVAVKQQDFTDAPAFQGRHLQAIGDATWARRMRLGGLSAGAHGLGPKFDNKTEPELFYQEKGKATHQEKVSEPEVLRRTIEYWRKRLKENPNLEYINVGPHDGSGFGTDPWDADDFDPILGKTATTDRYVKFFNTILADLQKDYPNVGLAFYAYTLEMRPPVREKPNPKILPMIAAIGLDRFHSINNPLSWEKQYLKTVVEGWQARGVQLMFRGYLFNLADHGLPFSMIDIVRNEWPYYHDKGFIAMRVECMPNWAYHAPALYLAARLYWNPHQNVDAILAEYFQRMYGPAAPAMKRHFDIVENAYINADFYAGNVFDVPKVLTPEIRKQMAETLAEAEKLAGTGNKIADRVHLVRLGFDYGEANFRMMDAFAHCDFIETKKQHDRIVGELIPAANASKPPVISRSPQGYLQRFWGRSVSNAYERVTNGREIAAVLPDEWRIFLDPYNKGEELFLFKPELGMNSWLPVKTWSQTTSGQGLRYYKWAAWYRCKVTVPAKYAGRKLRFWMGGVDDTPKPWINGKELQLIERGAAPIGRPWEFDATEAIEVGKENVIVVKVTDTFTHELGTFGINGPVMIWAEPRK